MLCLGCDLSSVMNQQTLQQLAIQKLLSMLHHYKPDLLFPMESVTSCCLSDLYMNPNYRSILLQDVFLFIYDHLYDDEINRNLLLFVVINRAWFVAWCPSYMLYKVIVSSSSRFFIPRIHRTNDKTFPTLLKRQSNELSREWILGLSSSSSKYFSFLFVDK